MLRNLLLALTLLHLALAGPDPFLIVPGQGFGGFTRKLDRAHCEKQLPAGQYMEDDQGGVSLYAMEPSKRITVRFSPQGVQSMTIHGLEGVWHTSEGIGLGTTLKKLEKLNGRPFRFRSLGSTSDAGRVLDWQGGKLQKRLPGVQLTFASAMHAKGYSGLGDAEHQWVEAEGKTYLSSHPVAQKLDPVVETLGLVF